MQLEGLSVFVLVFFVSQVWNKDMIEYETTFIGLPQEKGLGYSGYVNLPAESYQSPLEPSECLGFTINSTSCSFVEEIPENGLMVMQAWVAATVRQNMLVFLGFLLHQPNRIFNANAYRGVDIIYQQFRINNVKIMDIIQKLPAIYKVKRERQHREFLKVLKYHASIPKFFRGAIDGLLTILAKRKTRYYYTSTDKRRLNLFSNIPRKFLPYLRPTAYRKYDRAIRVDLGKEFAIFFSAIKEHKIRLTQPIVAVLMLHMRFDLLPPDENENFLYLIDILRYNRIPNWTPGFHGTAISASPYDFVNVTLAALASLPQVESSVKDIASKLQTVLKRSSRSNRTRIMEHFFNREDLSISLLLKALHKLISIPELDIFHGLVTEKKLNLNYALKSFNRYFYDSPHQLVLAFVKRVLNRVPMDETNREIVKKVYEALQKFKLECADHDKEDMEFQPEEVLAMDEVQGEEDEDEDEEEEEEEDDEMIEVEKEESERKEQGFVPKSTIDTDKYLNNSQKHKRHSRDRNVDDTSITSEEKFSLHASVSHTSCDGEHCISEMATEVFRPTQWENSPVMDLNCPKEPPTPSVSSWLNSLDSPVKGVGPSSLVANASIILSIFMNKSEIVSLISRLDGPSVRHSRGKSKSVKLVELKSRKNLLKSIFKKMLSIPKVQANRIVYYEVVRIYYILTHGLGTEDEREIFFSKLKLNDQPGTINKILSELVSEPLDKLIRNFHRLNDTQLADYPTNRSLLIHLFQHFLMFTRVKNNLDLFNEIIMLLRVVLEFPIEFPMLKQSDKLRHQDLHHFKQIYESLRKSDLVSILGDDFDLGRYPTIGRLFRKIGKKLSKVQKVRNNSNFTRIWKKTFLHRICVNFETKPVDKMLVGVQQQLNINKIVDRDYVDKTKITGVIAEAFTKIFDFHNRNFNSLLRMSSDNVSFDGMGTEFSRKFVDSIDEIVERNYLDVKKNIALMKSAIFTATPAD